MKENVLSPEEKAKELVNKYMDLEWVDYPFPKRKIVKHQMTREAATKSALLAVDLILNSIPLSPEYHVSTDNIKYSMHAEDYWNDVKSNLLK